ncbi:MAG: hypothetical protein ACRC1D_00755, partial [Culicoidibacterales bacterium]
MVRRDFRNGIKVVHSKKGARKINGVKIVDQAAVLFKNKATQQRLAPSKIEFDKFVNKQIKANAPPKQPGKKIVWKVDVAHRGKYKSDNTEYRVHYDTKEFQNVRDLFKTSDLKLSGWHHDGSESPENLFDLVIDDVSKLWRKFVIIYGYVDSEFGASEKNTCFLDCLKKFHGNRDLDETLYREIVPLNKMTRTSSIPLIEEAYQMNICIPGHYKSEMKHEYTMNLTLFDNHVELIEPIKRYVKVKELVEFKNRRIVLHKGMEVLELTSNGFSKRELSIEQYKEYRRRHKIRNIWLASEDTLTEEKWQEYNELEQLLRRKFNTSFTQYGSLAEFAYNLWLKIEEPSSLRL